MLEQLARVVASSAGDVLRSAIAVTFGSPTRCAAVDLDDDARAWCLENDGDRIWCIVSGPSQAELLACILDGPGAARPTPVERTIVGECIERLLAYRSTARWREVAAIRLTEDVVWRCDLQISSESRPCAKLQLCAPAASVVALVRPRLDEVPLVLRASLRPLRTTLGRLAGWRPGTRLALGSATLDLRASLTIQAGAVVYGLLGQMNGRYAIRLNGDAARASRA